MNLELKSSVAVFQLELEILDWRTAPTTSPGLEVQGLRWEAVAYGQRELFSSGRIGGEEWK